MSDVKHTAEPWKIGTPPPNGEQTIGTHDGLMVAVATTGAGVNSEANARRIVACVNACAGMSTDELERFGLGAAFGMSKIYLARQRDQLLAALEFLFASYKQLADSGDAVNWSLEDTDEGKKALAAIAAVKGEK